MNNTHHCNAIKKLGHSNNNSNYNSSAMEIEQETKKKEKKNSDTRTHSLARNGHRLESDLLDQQTDLLKISPTEYTWHQVVVVKKRDMAKAPLAATAARAKGLFVLLAYVRAVWRNIFHHPILSYYRLPACLPVNLFTF